MNLDDALDMLARNPQAPLDLAEVALGLARDEYADLDVDAYLGQFDAMAHEACRLVRGGLEAQTKGLCRYLFHDMGFHGNVKEYYDPLNSYVNQVLERRTGIPITLAAVVMAVGRRVGLEVEGVGLPGHFVVKVVEGNHEVIVDPFHGGRLLTETDCEHLVRQATGMTFAASPLTLEALPLGLIVQRMLNNLRGIYLGQEDFRRAVRVLERLLQLNTRDAALRRDLGTAWCRLDEPGKAIDHLHFYVTQAPEADDFEAMQTLLKNAERRVAEWN